jgi:predicted alpha/beta-fold hydrolase
MRSSAEFDSGAGRFYSRMILKSLMAKLEAKRENLRDTINVEHAFAAIKTVRDFDDYVTAPLGGFADANDYYRRCSSGQFLSAIKTPTLLIRACDDPFFDTQDIPHQAIAANPNLVPLLPKHGGHVGFVDSYRGNFWAGEQAASFLSHHLERAKIRSVIGSLGIRGADRI